MHLRTDGGGIGSQLLGGEKHSHSKHVCTPQLILRLLQKYGNVAFDSSQKAVLTTCVLRRKPNLSPGSLAAGTVAKKDDGAEEGFISCCFSFTIRRDKWGIPTMIVGNFIRC